MAQETALANINVAKKALDNAKDLTEVLDIRSKAAAMQAYATAKGSDELASLAVEIKLRSERKAGEFLKAMKERGELKKGQPKKEKETSQAVTLKELRIERMDSSRWQKLANIPEPNFEEYISNVKKKTQSGIIQVATQIKNKVELEAIPLARRIELNLISPALEEYINRDILLLLSNATKQYALRHTN